MSTRPPWEDYQAAERPPWEDYQDAERGPWEDYQAAPTRPAAVSLEELQAGDYERRGLLERGAETVMHVAGAPKRGVDAVARAVARAIGIPLPEDSQTTTGQMARQVLGFTPEYESDLPFAVNPERGGMTPSPEAMAVAGRAVETGVDLFTDPLVKALGTAGKVAGAGRTAEAMVGPQTPEAAQALAQAIGAGRRADTVGRGAAAALAPGMGSGALTEGVPAVQKAIAEGVDPATAEALFGAGVNAVFAAGTTAHAARGRAAAPEATDPLSPAVRSLYETDLGDVLGTPKRPRIVRPGQEPLEAGDPRLPASKAVEAKVPPQERAARAAAWADHWRDNARQGLDVTKTYEVAQKRALELEREIAKAEAAEAPEAEIQALRAAQDTYQRYSSERPAVEEPLPEDVGGLAAARSEVGRDVVEPPQEVAPAPDHEGTTRYRNDRERIGKQVDAGPDAERAKQDVPQVQPANRDHAARVPPEPGPSSEGTAQPTVYDQLTPVERADLMQTLGPYAASKSNFNVLYETVEQARQVIAQRRGLGEASAERTRRSEAEARARREPVPEEAERIDEPVTATEREVEEGLQGAAALLRSGSRKEMSRVGLDDPRLDGIGPKTLAKAIEEDANNPTYLTAKDVMREQIVDIKEREGFKGRSGERGAAATDILSGALEGVKKTLERKETDPPRLLSLRTVETQLRRMGKYGQGVANMLRRYEDVHEARAGRDVAIVGRARGGLGAEWKKGGGIDRAAVWEKEIVPALDGRLPYERLSAHAKRAVVEIRRVLDNIYETGAREGVLVANRIKDYFPRIFKDPDIFKSPEAVVKRLMAANPKLTFDDATAYVGELERQWKKGGRVFGSLERERTDITWPEEMLDRSPQALEQWIGRAHRRIAEVKMLGAKHEKINAFIDRLPTQEQRQYARDILRESTGTQEKTLAQQRADELAGKAAQFVAITRLYKGPISQLGTVATTGTYGGFWNVARHVYRAATGGKGLAGLKDFKNNLVDAQIDAAETGALHASVFGEYARTYGEGTWFAPWVGWTKDVDTAQRATAAGVAKMVAPKLIKSAQSTGLKARGDAKLLDLMKVPWKDLDPANLTPDQLNAFARKFSDFTQRRTGVLDSPALKGTPLGRAAMSLQNFTYQNMRLLRDAGKVAAAGRYADIGKLAAGFAVMGGVQGLMKAAAEGYANQTEGTEKIDLYGLDWSEPSSYTVLLKELRKTTGTRQVKVDSPEGVLYRLVQMMAAAGAFGLFQSAIERVTYSESAGEAFFTAATGPAGQSVVDLVGTPLKEFAEKGPKAAALALARGVTGHLPAGRQLEQEVVEQSDYAKKTLGARTDRAATPGYVGRFLDERGEGAKPGEREAVRGLRTEQERRTRVRETFPEELTAKGQKPVEQRFAQARLDRRRAELMAQLADAIQAERDPQADSKDRAAARAVRNRVFAAARRERISINLRDLERKLSGREDVRAAPRTRRLFQKVERIERMQEAR